MNLAEETTSENNNIHKNSLKNSNKSESLKIFSELKETLDDHVTLCTETDLALKDLLSNDTFLSDLPADVAPAEVLALIAVAKGVGFTIYVERDSLPKLKVIIPKIPSDSTVFDLKQSFRHAYELEQKRKYQKEILQHKIHTNNKQKSKKSSLTISNSPPPLVQSPPLAPPTKINWRYIWKTYVLAYDLKPLLDNNQSLSSYGIGNKSRLRFVKRVKIAKQQNKKRI